ncbi:Respiratory-chain NADH dehydrogenase, subunit [Balnearium lithotrophicum]|uniref:Respiratory-chain NADH dehydrogenase, subunit n=1 Tax=Balnearium lithotrophicum TaxID=223788 RepID=A0A521C1K6_9BACT|nr:NADH-quinone oxidoreductase subunit C [Balnearium lithotrophicum]SMO53339.1 Respiratory-chain NADH dehydrogenase, subunit [Balnearium lithotrophicum]
MKIEEIKLPLRDIRRAIKDFYDPEKWHFITVNGTDLGGKVKLKWFFASYEDVNRYTVFVSEAEYNDEVPTITYIVPSAWIAEWELADLLGLNVEGARKGLFLEPDSPQAPLRRG